MIEFVSKLFDTSDFPARWNCGNWDEFHGWLHIVSDMAIWGAYSMIPFALTYYWWSKRTELAFPRLFWLFGAFIFSCGTTHLIEAVIFYEPIYRISAVAKVVTALVSWVTVFAILRVAPKAMELPGMMRMNEKLQKQLLRTREAEAALARSNRDLEAFAGIVTHDLRTPMGSALLMAELARESLAAGNRDRAEEQIGMVLDSLKNMDASVRALHEQSLVRPKCKGFASVALGEVLATVRAELEPRLREAKARLKVEDLPSIEGNRKMLEHLFTNLVENAIKYRSARPPVIEVAARLENDHVLVTVTDNGRGVPEGEHEMIFEPEVRGGNVIDEPGSGLGLALCRRVMEGHVGTIRARRADGGGTVFELRFRRNDGKAA